MGKYTDLMARKSTIEKLRDFFVRYPRINRSAYRESIGRNAPCPCGSGKKYKKCCGGITND